MSGYSTSSQGQMAKYGAGIAPSHSHVTMLCLSRAAHGFIFQSWSKRTTTNEAKNNTYA